MKTWCAVAWVLLITPLPGAQDAAPEPERALLNALVDRDEIVRLEAAHRLDEAPESVWKRVVMRLTGTGSAIHNRVRALIARLDDDRWPEREKAEKALVALGKVAVVALENAKTSSPSLEVRWRAGRALKQITRVDPRLSRLWEQRAGELRSIAWALAVHPPSRPERAAVAADVLAYSLEDQDAVLRKHVLMALARLGDPRALPGLKAMVRTGQEAEALSALWQISLVKKPEAVAFLRECAGSGGSEIKRLAAWSSLLAAGAGPGPFRGDTLGPWLQKPPPPAVKPPAPAGRWTARLVSGVELVGELRQLNAHGLLLRLDSGVEVPVPVTRLAALHAGGEAKPDPAGEWVLFNSGTWLPGRVERLGPRTARVVLAHLGAREVPRGVVRAFGRGRGPGVETVLPGRDDRVVTADKKEYAGQGITVEQGRLKSGDGRFDRALAAVRLCVLGAPSRARRGWREDRYAIYAYPGLVVRGGGIVKGFLLAGGPGGVRVLDPLLGVISLATSRLAEVRFLVGTGPGITLTLITDFQLNEVVELDSKGRRIWFLKDLGSPWDAEWLPNGNLMLLEQQDGTLKEMTRSGKVVWKLGGLKIPYDADKLPNGNYLIADTGNQQVIEVTPDRKVVWRYKGVEAFDVDRLPSGNTLIADWMGKRVIEVDRGGRIVWALNKLNEVYDADRLPNGNTLITLWGAPQERVIEVDRSGKVVWQYRNVANPTDADRLPGGQTLIAGSDVVQLVDYKGKIIWKHKVDWAVEVNRY